MLARLNELSRDYQDAQLGVSIGLAWFENPPLDPDALIQRADAAMYKAKAAGKGKIVVSLND